MNVKFTFEQSVIAYVSLPQEAGSVYHALVRDHGEGCDHPSHSNQRGGRDHHHLQAMMGGASSRQGMVRPGIRQ